MDESGNPISTKPRRRPPISVPGRRSFPDDVASVEAEPRDESTTETVETGTNDQPQTESETDAQAESFGTQEVPKVPLRIVLLCCAIGCIMHTICLAPLGLGQAAFLAAAPWAWLTLDARRLGVLRYAMVYVSAFVSWIVLLLIETELGGGRLAENSIVLAYVSFYFVLFVFLGRIARRTFGLPSYIALPIVWGGLEWLRCHLLGGISLGMLGHAVADTPRIMQLADLAGSYGLGMLMVASGSSVAELIWVSRRIRRLEQKLPQVQTQQADDSRVFTSAGKFMIRPRFNHAKESAQTSFEDAVRRNRDRARDLHLVSVTLSISVMVGVLVFANYYGQSRVQETRTWKMFEANQFPWTVLGGPESAEVLIEQSQRADAESLLVTAVKQPVDIEDPKRPILLVAPNAEEARKGSWRVWLDGDEKGLPNFESDSFSLWLRRSPIAAFIAQKDLPVNLMVTSAPSTNIEQVVHDALRRLPRRGRRSSIDAAIVVIQPGSLAPRSLPRLLTRSVAAAAVANRCPIIAIIPEETVSIATGDGKLVWSSILASDDRSAGDPFATKESTSVPIRVQSMVDPRLPAYLGSIGHSIGPLSFLLTVALPILGLWSRRRRVE